MERETAIIDKGTTQAVFLKLPFYIQINTRRPRVEWRIVLSWPHLPPAFYGLTTLYLWLQQHSTEWLYLSICAFHVEYQEERLLEHGDSFHSPPLFPFKHFATFPLCVTLRNRTNWPSEWQQPVVRGGNCSQNMQTRPHFMVYASWA